MDQLNSNQKSRFIISPYNYWYLQWNNSIQIVFVIYIFLFPLVCVQNTEMSQENLGTLLIFDVIFMVDRLLDLFEGYNNPSGFLEHRVIEVIKTNINFKFFLEIFVSFAPIIFKKSLGNSSSAYICFKSVRYLRKFELD